jgi:hypothetical protein
MKLAAGLQGEPKIIDANYDGFVKYDKSKGKTATYPLGARPTARGKDRCEAAIMPTGGGGR